MSRVRVHGFGISLDGFSAGPNQDLQNPLGVRGPVDNIASQGFSGT